MNRVEHGSRATPAGHTSTKHVLSSYTTSGGTRCVTSAVRGAHRRGRRADHAGYRHPVYIRQPFRSPAERHESGRVV